MAKIYWVVQKWATMISSQVYQIFTIFQNQWLSSLSLCSQLGPPHCSTMAWLKRLAGTDPVSTVSERIFKSTVLGSDRQSEFNSCTKIDSFRSVILIPNPSRSEPNNFSFNSLLSFRSPIWTYNYPFTIGRLWRRHQGILFGPPYVAIYNTNSQSFFIFNMSGSSNSKMTQIKRTIRDKNGCSTTNTSCQPKAVEQPSRWS